MATASTSARLVRLKTVRKTVFASGGAQLSQRKRPAMQLFACRRRFDDRISWNHGRGLSVSGLRDRRRRNRLSALSIDQRPGPVAAKNRKMKQ